MQWFGVAAFGLSVVAWISCFFVAKVPGWRRTLWPSRALFYVAMILSLVDFRMRGSHERTWTLATFISFTLFIFYNHLVLRMPRVSGAPRAGDPLPELELVGEDGKPLRLAGYRDKGPLLLIFFRGFW